MRVSRAIAGLGRAHSSAILALATMVVLLTACDGSFLEPGPVGEIAEVRISLESHTFTALEESLTVEAEALDGTGTRVPDVTLEWQSSDPSIVSVDPMGMVTAKAAGTALVIVAAAAVADTAFFTVAEDGEQRQPAADGLLFADDFESGDTGHSQNGFRWNNPNWVASTEQSYSGAHALRFHYPGEPRGQDHNSELRFTIAEAAAEAPSEVWIEYMLRIPDNFVHRNEWKAFGQNQTNLIDGGIPFTGSVEAGSDILTLDQAGAFPDFVGNGDKQAVTRWQARVVGAGEGGEDISRFKVVERLSDRQVRLEAPAATTVTGAEVDFYVNGGLNNKFFMIWAENYEGGATEANFLLEFQHDDTSAGDVTWAHPRYALGLGEGMEGQLRHYTNFRAPLFRTEDRGQWVRMRFHLLIDDTDGQYEVWRDDTLVADLLPGTRTSEGEGRDYFRRGYLLGWANSGYSEDTTFYIDSFKVYVADPGW